MLPVVKFQKVLVLICTLSLVASYPAILLPHPVQAVIFGCSASASPSVVPANSSVTVSFNITNNDPVNAVNWVRIARPSARYTVTGGSSGGWTATVSNPDSVTFAGGTVAPSGSQSFSVNVDTSALAAASQSWPVDVSDNGGGVTTGCGGASTSISTDTAPPVISNVQSSNVTDTTATITWTTDESSSSVVEYGSTTSYGSTAAGNSDAISHTVNLTGLLNGSTYHYRVRSADAVGNSGQSGDYTFVTTGPPSTTPAPTPAPTPASSSSSPSSSSPGSSGSSSSPSSGSTTTSPPAAPADSIKPTVRLSNNFSKPFKSAPVLAGAASDNVGVEKVEYSLDGGRNWLPVGILSNKGGFQTNFSTAVRKLEDGNYQVLIRATDKSGNVGFSAQSTIIIDQLPPLIGPSLVTVGPQILIFNDGKPSILANVSQKITLSAIGGATQVDLIASSGGQFVKKFAFEKNPDNGLWSSNFDFDQAGLYQLTAEALDGAGNKFNKVLGELNALANGQITDGNSPVKDAQVQTFFFDQATQRFISWGAGSYSQQNPQQVNQEGRYKLLLPPGKYYLQIKAPGYKSIKTTIFTLEEFTPFNQDFKLARNWSLGMGKFQLSLPDFTGQLVKVELPKVDNEQMTNPLIGQKIFDFSLSDGEQSVNSAFLEGKPTVISFLNSWLPQAAEQLSNLENLRKDQQIQTVVVLPLESASFVQSFRRSNGYQTLLFADPEGKLLGQVNLSTNPTHLLIDQRGVIQKIRYGLLTSDEIKGNLIN